MRFSFPALVKFVLVTLFAFISFASMAQGEKVYIYQFLVKFTDPGVHRALKMDPNLDNSHRRNRMEIDREYGERILALIAEDIEIGVVHVKSMEDESDLLQINSKLHLEALQGKLEEHHLIDKVQQNKRFRIRVAR